MAGKISQIAYLAQWFFRARFLGRRAPMQSVVFISDKCNLSCKHCSVYNHTNPIDKKWDKVIEDIKYCLSIGSRFIDFEGGEPMLWSDRIPVEKLPKNSPRLKGGALETDENGLVKVDVSDLCDLAHEMGIFSCTITTNAQKPFAGVRADSIWVSMDGIGEYHNKVRGEGTFARLEKNLSQCGHKAVSVSMSVNTLNVDSVPQALEYAKNNPAIRSICFNFHTPFSRETDYLFLSQEVREKTIDMIIDYKKKGYPIMNTKVGLRKMKKLSFKPQCWITNYIYMDGTRKPQCAGKEAGVCDKCGFSMSAEMHSVLNFHPETILAGLKLRVE